MKSDLQAIGQYESGLLFDYIDNNKSGLISFNEFRHHFDKNEKNKISTTSGNNQTQMNSRIDTSLNNELRSLFRQFDSNRDNCLDISEFHEVLLLLKYNISHEIASVEFNKCDLNSDMRIDFEEFSYLIINRLRIDYIENHKAIKNIKQTIIDSKQNPSDDKLSYRDYDLAMSKLNFGLSHSQKKCIFSELDFDQKQQIYVQDFMILLMSSPEDYEQRETIEAIRQVSSNIIQAPKYS